MHVPLPSCSPTPTAARRQLIDPVDALDLRPGDPYGGAALQARDLVGREWQRGTVHVAVVDNARNLVANA